MRIRTRLLPLSAAVLTFSAGLLLQVSGDVPGADKLGDLLYAALVFLLLWTVWPAVSWPVLGAGALLGCSAVELVQLTTLPTRAREWFPPIRLVLGSGFDAHDFVAYAAGVGLASLLWWWGCYRRRAGNTCRSRPMTARPE